MQHAVVVVVEAAELTPRLAAHAEVVEAADADERARRVGKGGDDGHGIIGAEATAPAVVVGGKGRKRRSKGRRERDE